MAVFQKRFEIDTDGHGHMHRIDDQVQRIITESGIMTGTVNVSNVGSTGSIGTIEYEPGLERDLPEILNKLIPPGRHYGHELAWHDGNAHSHLQATIMGPSLTIPIGNGQLIVGTWQQIFHIDCDNKARQRSVVVTVMGE